MNYLLIVVLIMLLWRVIVGFKHGMVKEVQSFVTFLVGAFSLALVAKAVSAFANGEKLHAIIAIVLLVILGAIFKIVDLLFFSAKTIAKLPIVHILDKLLGIVIGGAEVILSVWAFYYIMSRFQFGTFTTMMAENVADNKILMYLYNHNFLEKLIEHISVWIVSVF